MDASEGPQLGLGFCAATEDFGGKYPRVQHSTACKATGKQVRSGTSRGVFFSFRVELVEVLQQLVVWLKLGSGVVRWIISFCRDWYQQGKMPRKRSLDEIVVKPADKPSCLVESFKVSFYHETQINSEDLLISDC